MAHCSVREDDNSNVGITEDFLHRPHIIFPDTGRRSSHPHGPQDSVLAAGGQRQLHMEHEDYLAIISRLPEYNCHISQVPAAASHFTRLVMNPRELDKVRPHQHQALAALLDQDAESFLSGCVVLPCGSGKTLVGVMAAAVMRRRTLVVCATVEQVDQWWRQLVRWTLLLGHMVYRCGSSKQQIATINDAAVILATYHWLSGSQEVAGVNARVRRGVLAKTYGLLLLDEVHKLPAAVYRHLPRRIRSSWRVGLTADLSREAEEEHEILKNVGPVRTVASVTYLVHLGVIAPVEVLQIVAPLARGFVRVIEQTPGRDDLHRLLLLLNPYKFCYLMSLIQFVEYTRHQKLLVMFEELLHLQVFAIACDRPWACGSNEGRESIVHNFQMSHSPTTLLVSRISDTGLDVPDLSYCLQLGGLGGSRQQEVQRVGRVQRHKPDGRKSEFHTVVTSWPTCPELEYSRHRNTHLQELGYHVRPVLACSVLSPIPSQHNIRLATFARVLGRKLSTELRETVNAWILRVYPGILRSLPHRTL